MFPLLHLGRLLKARGHEATLVSMDYFESAIKAAGLEFVTFGSREEFDRISENPDIWKPFKGTRMVFEAAMGAVKPVYDAILQATKRHPDHGVTLVSPGTNFGARLARETLKAPLITVHLQPISVLSASDFPVFHHRLAWLRQLPLPFRKALMRMPNPIDWMARSRLRPMCEELKVSLPRSVVQEWWHSPDANLMLFPKEFAAPQADWPVNVFQHVFPLEDLAKEQPLAPELSRFLDGGSPPVLFTPGTGNRHARAYFETALEACMGMGQRAIFATRHLPDVPAKLPASVIALEYVPFSHVLPRCAVLVHHGGIGTMSQALAAGIPQLIMPLAHDQPDNAQRILEQGLGDFLPPSRFTAPNLRKKLSCLLTNAQMKANCGAWSERLRLKAEPRLMLDWMESAAHCQ